MHISLSVLSHLSPQVVAEVREIIRVATLIDDMAPLSEQVLIQLELDGDNSAEHVLVRNDLDQLVGYLHLDRTDEVSGPVAEIVVHPEFRKNKIGTKLIEFAIAEPKNSGLRLWAHGEHAGAYALAIKMGFSKSRELWQMRRSLYAELPKFEAPVGNLIREFKVGHDEQAWLNLNAEVFAKHPEQGRLDQRALEIRMRESWFNPAGFIVSENIDGQLTGYNWTKVHGSIRDNKTGLGHPELGEIYVLGVKPEQRGTGLSKSLAVAGLNHLRAQGLSAALLYVDRDNLAAIKLYESIGFAHWDTDVMFQA